MRSRPCVWGRLKGYDYTQPGSYFITICTHNRIPLFGDMVDGEMRLNAYADDDVGARRRRAPTEQFGKPVLGSIPTIVRAFKSAVTRCINAVRNALGAPV